MLLLCSFKQLLWNLEKRRKKINRKRKFIENNPLRNANGYLCAILKPTVKLETNTYRDTCTTVLGWWVQKCLKNPPWNKYSTGEPTILSSILALSFLSLPNRLPRVYCWGLLIRHNKPPFSVSPNLSFQFPPSFFFPSQENAVFTSAVPEAL